MSTPRVVRTIGISLVAVLAISLGLRLTWANKPVAKGVQPDPLDPKTYVSAAVPDEENAAPWLRAASQALVLTKDQRSLIGDLTSTAVEGWTPAQREQLRLLLDQAGPAMDLLQRALRFTQTSYGLDLDDLKRVEMNRQKLPLIDLIHLNRFLYVAARDALDRGDKERFLSAAKPMPLLALSMERESPLIATLVGIACDKMLVDLIRLAIARPQTDHLTLDEVEQLIPDNDLRAVWRRTITSEFALAPLRRDQATVPLPTEQERAALDRSLLSADAATRSAAIVAFTEVLDTPFGSSPDWLATQERRITEATKAGVETPNLVRAAGRFQHTLSARHLARLALALRREAMRTGSYPATLASLPGASQPDLFAGTPPVLSLNPDGSAVLTIPAGVYKRFYTDVQPPELNTWQLPVPTRR